MLRSLPPILEMICPNCALVTSVTGGVRAGWLKMLKNSARNCTLYFSLNRVFLISEKSVLIRRWDRRFGWLNESVGTVNGAAAAKAVVSNQWLSVWPPESTGLCSRLARPLVAEKLYRLVWSGPMIRIGLPLWNTEIPLNSQPPRAVAAKP